MCNFFYRFFVFVHFIVSVLYKDFQIFFFGVSPNISYCNRNRYITLLISKVNLRAYLFYDLLGLSGGLKKNVANKFTIDTGINKT